ncbi:MAG: Periplasmic thiol:disulfide interchange protein DsbA [Labilithrix sp.]|nr:Periplasmic thiol:disulfide interchange protein DsbA [Labilithrix sp.]
MRARFLGFVLVLVSFVSFVSACDDVTGAPRTPAAAATTTAPAAPGAETELAVPIAADDPVRGKRDAYLTIVTFSDYQCPYCGRLAAVLERVRETYGDDVRIVFKNDPLSNHEHARLAAEVGAGVFALAGADAFWRYHDAAFRRQRTISPEAIRAWAISAGVDSRSLEEGLAAHHWSAKVRRDESLADTLGVNGTPVSFVNGIEVPGAQPFEKWKALLDVTLEEAKRLEKEGTPREALYARMVTSGGGAAKRDAKKDDDDDAPDVTVWRIPIGTSPARGDVNAPVTIVEFGDFQCPYCKKAQPTLARIESTYGSRVRFVWKDNPLSFHKRAMPAAELARFARATKGDAAFWKIHEKLFASSALEDADLESAARDAGLDPARAMSSVHASTYKAAIEKDAELADDVGASGAPHFYVNGRHLVGAQPFDTFKEIIDAELVKADAMTKAGVAPSAVYDAIVKDGEHAPDPERRSVAASVQTAPFRGAAGGKVVIQEFSDFQCPYCGRAEGTITELLKAYPTQVKVVWRNLPLPFHDQAALAAEAAREAFVQKGNEGFSRYRELLFAHQREEDGLARPALLRYGTEAGLDVARLERALDEHTHRASIEQDKKAASDADISGTPAFFVGPYVVNGAQPLSRFKRLVERVLAESGKKN